MEERELYREAGAIAARVMREGVEKARPGGRLLDLVTFIEGRIRELEARPAFPCNLSLNDVAAHYTPTAWDETLFRKGDLLKLDIGVHVQGYIADIARTVVVGGGGHPLIDAAEKALSRAVEEIGPGARTNEVGRAIEETIEAEGFHPVVNLTGHKLGRFQLHGGTIIPNIWTRHGEEIQVGDVFAVEPFATDGLGKVTDDPNAVIFRYLRDRPLRMREARMILHHVKEHYGHLPFAERWISPLVPRTRLNPAIRQLVFSGALHAYHILREKNRGLVAQAEHTVIVTENGCEVTTA
jgi:methionyl aminopeptidase